MHLFNASSLFNENAVKEILEIVNDPEELRNRMIEVKKTLLKIYNFKVYNVPKNFTISSYIISHEQNSEYR